MPQELKNAIALIGEGDPSANPAAKISAVQAIVDHASVCDVNRMDLSAAGAIPPLVALLDKGSDIQKRQCIKALQLLVTNNPLAVAFDNGGAVVQAGGLRPIIALFNASGKGDDSESTSDESLEELAAATLRLIARSSANRSAIAKEGAIQPLVALVKQGDADEGARAEAAFALGSLVFDHAENRAAVSKEGGVKALSALARSGTPRQQQTASYALTALQPRTTVAEGEPPPPYEHKYEERGTMLGKYA